MFRTSDSSSYGHASSSPAFEAGSGLPDALLSPLLFARSSITVTTRRCLWGQGKAADPSSILRSSGVAYLEGRARVSK